MDVGTLDIAALIATHEMSFTSPWFFAVVYVALVLYWCVPARHRWLSLLAASVAFSLLGGWQVLVAALMVAIIAHAGALGLASLPRERRGCRKALLLGTSLTMVVALAYTKAGSLLNWSPFGMAPAIGMSYYTFSAIAYMADVYRGRIEAQTNPLRTALFVLWFPKMLEGPIERYENLQPQLEGTQHLSWRKFCFGLQLALWGYLKKMVVADRLSVVTTQLLGQQEAYGGALVLACAVLAAFELYCDFSGCIDIARGVSELFGIELADNFRQPFLSRSAAEFWRRWHITLGTWFKDYVYMPVSVSKPVLALAQKARARFGRRAGANVMKVVPLLVVWVLTGLWHGTGWSYLVWGLYWGIIIAAANIFGKAYAGMAKRLRLNTGSSLWHAFQTLRTFVVFCVARLITMPRDLSVTARMLMRIVGDFRPWELFDGTLYTLGLDHANLLVLAAGLAVVVVVDVLHERGLHLREAIRRAPMPLREAFWAAACIALLVFGMYGPAYSTGAFTYMSF